MSFAFAESFCHLCVSNTLRVFCFAGVEVRSEFAQLVGTTRSSKAICQPLNIDDKTLATFTGEYLPDDHFDAYCLFQFFLSRELSRIGPESTRAGIYNKISNFHRKAIRREEMRRQKKSLGIATIFDVIKFGNSPSHPILVDKRPLRIK